MEKNLYKPNNNLYQDNDSRGSKLVTFLLPRSENPCLIKGETCKTESEFISKKDSDSINTPASLALSPSTTTKSYTFWESK